MLMMQLASNLDTIEKNQGEGLDQKAQFQSVRRKDRESYVLV
jgi:hypothetical protein